MDSMQRINASPSADAKGEKCPRIRARWHHDLGGWKPWSCDIRIYRCHRIWGLNHRVIGQAVDARHATNGIFNLPFFHVAAHLTGQCHDTFENLNVELAVIDIRPFV
jgi:hypothetical protein